MSLDRLLCKIKEMKNPTVAGLDPKLDYVPDYIKSACFKEHGETLEGAAEALYRFNRGLIDALYDIVPAVKPQCAYYEMYGWQGVRALHKTICYAKEKGMFVIADAKRNDIGTTMEAYAAAYLGTTVVGSKQFSSFSCDALTVNAYLGSDGINPLLPICKKEDKGIFVLCKTSNPSSGELQDKLINETAVYAQMGQMCESWGSGQIGAYGYSAVGAVVGATYPKQLKELRAAMPHTVFLVPGYGAQGGGASDVISAFDESGLGAVINSSRAIMCSYKKNGVKETEYAIAARNEALRMRDEIAAAIESK